MNRWSIALSALLVLTFHSFTSAHLGHGTHGFSHGFVHPFSGIDHLLAMFVVGWWSTRQSEGRVWLLPLVFVGSMILGLVQGIVGWPLPGVDQGIAISVLLLGVLLAAGKKVIPIGGAVAVTALSAFYHGHAHGSEMPEDSSALTFVSGMILATAILHVSGMAMGLCLSRRKSLEVNFARVGGAAVACCGLAQMVGPL